MFTIICLFCLHLAVQYAHCLQKLGIIHLSLLLTEIVSILTFLPWMKEIQMNEGTHF